LFDFNFNSIPKSPYTGIHTKDIGTVKKIIKSASCNSRASPKVDSQE